MHILTEYQVLPFLDNNLRFIDIHFGDSSLKSTKRLSLLWVCFLNSPEELHWLLERCLFVTRRL